MGGVLYEPARIYLLSSWMPTLLNHRGDDLAAGVVGDCRRGWRHAGALLLGVLMDRLNPFGYWR